MKLLLLPFILFLGLYADISIEDAWKNVEFKNDGLKGEEIDVKRAELKRSSAKSMYLPSMSITGSYTHLSEPIKIEGEIDLSALQIPGVGSIPYSSDLSKKDIFLADLHILWPLYTGGRIDAAQDIFVAQVHEAKAKQEMKKDLEFLKLIKYYYGVVVSESLLKTRELAESALALHYENAKKLKISGQIANIELLNAEVKLDGARIETSKAKHKYEIALSALATVIKCKDKPNSRLFVNEIMQDEEYYKTETAKKYVGLAILDAKESQSKSLVALKEAAWYPEVAAYGNYNLYKDDSPLMQTLPTWFAGVMVKINLLQRKDRSQDVQAAELLSAKVKYLKIQAVEDLKLLVEKTYKEMLSDYEEFNALNSSLKLSRENYRLRNIAFKEGLSTSVELVDAQMFLLGAKTKRLNAAYNFVQKVSQLCVLSGNREMFFDVAQRSEEISH
ncbi:TolC family protein [Sulfurimonas sp. SAG-AH-194-L11]|nr:TolC family protein [Sulfurimonas sp. SAG-AH-194-L11]MDF1876354.1 TolC family protein [Sulfurimonas sp. SAG-AH-194-L11]